MQARFGPHLFSNRAKRWIIPWDNVQEWLHFFLFFSLIDVGGVSPLHSFLLSFFLFFFLSFLLFSFVLSFLAVGCAGEDDDGQEHNCCIVHDMICVSVVWSLYSSPGSLQQCGCATF